MQGMVGGDNNRIPVVFQVPDIYRFVGEYQEVDWDFSCDF